MFKSAYVRGVQNALIQGGHVAYPDENTAAKIADYIADRLAFDHSAVAKDVCAKIASALISAHEYGQKQGWKTASFAKVASVEDLSKLAHQHALDVMQKAAEGSNYEGGDKGNKERASAEGKMDEKARPEGYAADSRGKTDVDTRPGAVGKEQDQPNKPSETPAGSNSVTEQSKGASLAELIAKVAEGSNYEGGDKGNKERTTAEGKMDEKARPEGYAVLPNQGALGDLMALYSAQSAVGKEQSHPNGPSNTPGGSNSLTETSGKSASAEDPYLSLFKKTAAEVIPYLPTALGEETKIAHVRACMGMTTKEKAQYLVGLQKEAADKSTPALPPGSRGDGYAKHNPDATHSRPGAYDGRGANQGTKQAGELPPFLAEKKDEEKKEEGKSTEGEKKEDDKKEASLADHFRRISAALATK